MAINSNDIIDEVRRYPKEQPPFPVEVRWPNPDGTGGETRKVMAVSVENSGDPEMRTLVLICGRNYEGTPLMTDRMNKRVNELEPQIPDDMDWTTQNMPNRLNKVRGQYDKGIITDDEFVQEVSTMHTRGNDIEAP